MNHDRISPADLPEPTAPGRRTPSDTSCADHDLSRRDTDFGLGDEHVLAADPLVGTEVGDVRLEAVIGQGGMGRVYRGHQRAPARGVAVKTIRPGPRSAIALARFAREAEVLGRLRHPGIAQIHSAGSFVGPAGPTPYFVMELVPDATTIVRWCERHGLPLRERLRLLADACRAVGHGHAAGVVHRDLKPGNILVGADGQPRVIDFGVAKLADDLDADAAVTETGQCVGTRQYMSPEQFGGAPVDARSDVYSLGVILHELVAGELPYDVARMSLVETARIVRETRPRLLHVREAGLGPGLDSIATRCLAKSPTDRYPSATALADDLTRVAAGRPATASSPRQISSWAAAVLALALVLAAGLAARRLTTASRSVPQPLTARFHAVSSGRTEPLAWVGLEFDADVPAIAPRHFTLDRDGQPLPTAPLVITGSGRSWKIAGLETVTADEGRYELRLRDAAAGPVDADANPLAAPASVAWTMPPYRRVAFDMLGHEWREHVVSMTDVEAYTERVAGATSFIRPTVPGREGSVVMRFDAPFEIRSAALMAGLAVWTTGDPFPYDAGAKAGLDVSPDGARWTTLTQLEAGRGGFDNARHDIGAIVSGGTSVWVRARLAATKEWPRDGMIFAQFLRTDPQIPGPRLVLTMTGTHPLVIPLDDR